MKGAHAGASRLKRKNRRHNGRSAECTEAGKTDNTTLRKLITGSC
jgi:hypothetical protein